MCSLLWYFFFGYYAARFCYLMMSCLLIWSHFFVNLRQRSDAQTQEKCSKLKSARIIPGLCSLTNAHCRRNGTERHWLLYIFDFLGIGGYLWEWRSVRMSPLSWGMRRMWRWQSLHRYSQLGHEDDHFDSGDHRHLLSARRRCFHLALQPHQGIHQPTTKK